jgi:hypothetical protein
VLGANPLFWMPPLAPALAAPAEIAPIAMATPAAAPAFLHHVLPTMTAPSARVGVASAD